VTSGFGILGAAWPALGGSERFLAEVGDDSGKGHISAAGYGGRRLKGRRITFALNGICWRIRIAACPAKNHVTVPVIRHKPGGKVAYAQRLGRFYQPEIEFEPKYCEDVPLQTAQTLLRCPEL